MDILSIIGLVAVLAVLAFLAGGTLAISDYIDENREGEWIHQNRKGW